MKCKRIQSISLSASILLSAFLVPQSSFAVDHLPVTVYKDAPYSGASQEFDVGSYNVGQLSTVGNDAISSIRVAPGYKVTLYKDANFSGSTKVLTSDQLYLDDFNDVTSSLKIEKISPIDATSVQVPNNTYNDASKNTLLQMYAPRIWMAQGETYFPSSVEFAQPHLQRYLNSSSGNYEYKTVQPLSSPSTKLPFFAGDLANAPVYAFWVEKEYNNIDLVYFQFSPYNLGKVVVGSEFGNHVGDWERITVRLAKFTDNNNLYVKPVNVYYGAHSFGTGYRWDEVTKVNGTHAVGYSALGSHGMWKDPGSHVYQNIVVAQLTDDCSAGTAWDTWNNMKNYEYFPSQSTGRGLNTSWPEWLNKDYTNPNSGSVYRWGNPSQGSLFGQPLLDNGPTGPQEKTSLTDGTKLD
ncbi:Vps62-related protein [Paenibacillus filicis]|uniref:Vps62-related protein n=1 Tax=Paenibacillus filicis TaxID=669464 RepID=A0ABU9DSH1_9BACL